MPSRSNRSSGGSKSDYNDIGYNRGAQSGYNTASSGGYNHGAGSKRKSHYQKSSYQKSNNRDGRSKKYHGAGRKSKPRAASSRIDSPPEEILLIGDSMLRNIDPDGYKQAVWLFSYPGINASQARFLKFRFFDPYNQGSTVDKIHLQRRSDASYFPGLHDQSHTLWKRWSQNREITLKILSYFEVHYRS